MGSANRTIKSSDGAVLPLWEFLGGETLVPDGGNIVANMPPTTEIFHAVAQGGEVRYAFSPIAQEDSHGYIAQNNRVVVGPIRDLYQKGLAFWGDGVTVHIEYYRENRG